MRICSLFQLSKEHEAQAAAKAHLANVFAAILQESPSEARQLVTRWQRERIQSRNMWLRCSQDKLSDIIQRAGEINVPGETALQQWLQDSNQGTVLLTIHMSEYLYALFRLLSLCSPRHIVILRRKNESDEEQRCFARLQALGHTVETVRHSNTAAPTLIRKLRQGAVAVLLFDLPARWGHTTPVRMFGQTFNWVSGPLQIAMSGRAKVIPFCCVRREDQTHCELFPAYDYPRVDRNKLNQDRQRLCTHVESVIRQHPEQWHHWHLVSEMLSVNPA